MRFDSTLSFINHLESIGELKRIKTEVDPVLEITEIADRVMKAKGPALLFENVKGSKFPLAINLLGSEKRMALSWGVKNIEEVAKRIEELFNISPPQGWIDKLKMLPTLGNLAKILPKHVTNAACQEVVKTGDQVKLSELPVIQCWPDDGGKYITLGQVFTRSLKTGRLNTGMYRIQIVDEQNAFMHWHVHHDGARHSHEYKQEHKRMEVAVALGGDPVMTYAASAPLPPEVEEVLLAGFIRQQGVELVKCKTVDIDVPANADFVLEGYLDLENLGLEGPFGDHTGFYSLADYYPKFHITAITYRKDAVYPTTIVGKPPMEDLYMGKATERIFLPMLKTMVPEIVDMNFPVFGVFHNCVFVSINKTYPHQAKTVMNKLWGLGQMMFTKMIVVFDKEVNVQDEQDCLWRLTANTDPKRDYLISEGPVDVLDHSASQFIFGSKVGIDATIKWKEEGFTREWPGELLMSASVKQKVDQRWKEYGL